ncbi:S24 family peptidase [Comamonas koreensis]|uniref:Peptidase S24 n=1 Tax=Comamonas koreensis TaxID=160825 RepID=A0AAW4XYX5_9BURK|nr:S24 family peptidase [Comamonas koreensis]MCD2166839.1 peptidase S24 [Comamonas koreensis]
MNSKKETESVEDSGLAKGIGSRLRTELERLSLKADYFSDIGKGYAKGTIYAWARGDNSPPAAFLSHAADAGMDVQFIITGKRAAEGQDVLASSRHALTGPAPTPAHSEDTLYIPLLSATGSMGPGSEALAADVVMGDVPVSLTWVQMNLPRSRPEALRLVHAYGDSMRGTLESGDFALVDTDIHSVDADGVYVLEAHQRLFIKRVRQRIDGRYEISSDNPAIKQTDILNGGHEVRICGMVVYGWNGRRF